MFNLKINNSADCYIFTVKNERPKHNRGRYYYFEYRQNAGFMSVYYAV